MRKSKLWRLMVVLMAMSLFAAACGSDDDDDGDAAAEEEVAADDDAAAEAPSDDVATAECEVDEIDGDLAMYNWAEYIDPEQLALFEEEYDVSITEDFYDSNEAMGPIISAGNSGFDLVVPSDYFVSVLVSGEDLLVLNKDALPNMVNLLPEFGDPAHDPGNTYSVPYQWGSTGIGVDTAVVGTDFPRSWSIIFDPAFADDYSGLITLLNDPRETMGAALKYLGYSLNTTSEEELAEATQLVSDAKANLAAFDTDSAEENVIAGQTAIAHTYSGDWFSEAVETETPDSYVYFVPEEGGARWIDTIAIPVDAPHPCTAHTFINWLLRGEQGAALSNWNYYSTPNEESIPDLDEELIGFVTDPEQLTSGPESLEQFIDTGDFEINYSDAFIEAKG